MLDDNRSTREIGMFLTAVGLLFTLLGVVLFFDRGFLAIGNIATLLIGGLLNGSTQMPLQQHSCLAFLAGTALLIGLRKTSRFFFQWHKLRGSIFFFTGILLIIVFGYTFVGLVVEAFGFVSLFGDIIPVALVVARQLPIIGPILSHPMLNRLLDRSDSTSLPV